MKKNKILVTFLIIFIVISFLLGSYIIYKEYFKDNKCDDPKSEIKENTNYVVDLVNVKKELKYVGSCSIEGGKGNIDVKLPKINIDTTNISGPEQLPIYVGTDIGSDIDSIGFTIFCIGNIPGTTDDDNINNAISTRLSYIFK